jgi:hypothetical protein
MKIAPFAVLAALAATMVATPVLAANPKPINYEARAKACDAMIKSNYTADGRIHVRGYCLSNIPHESYRVGGGGGR